MGFKKEDAGKDSAILHACYAQLNTIGTPMDLPKNFTLCTAGNSIDSCYLIESGRVISFEITHTGRQHVFSYTGNNGPDSLILLPSIVLNCKVTLSFMTATPAKLVRIQRNDLMRLLSSDIEFANQILYILASKFVEVNERFRADSSKSGTWKLCHLLSSLANQYGVDYDGKVLIQIKYSQQMMADYLHMNRTTVARIMKRLTDSGLIERINDYYCIRNPEKLQHYLENADLLEDE